MKEILEKVLKYHIADVENSKELGYKLDGLCIIAANKLSKIDYNRFLEYLGNNTDGDIGRYIWDRNNDNTERIVWLEHHIKLNK